MMKHKLFSLTGIAVITMAFMIGGLSWAQDEGEDKLLKVGDKAPALALTEWVKGAPVRLTNDGEDKNVYVVEFWATWCPPCRASIPHLTELQQTYKDRNVTVIGITMEEPDVVKPFVQEAGETMAYTVAIDGDKKTWAAYMDASGARGIPHAFVVDTEGRIAWKGHPMDKALDATVAKLAPQAATEGEV